jgi:hypothetical protein
VIGAGMVTAQVARPKPAVGLVIVIMVLHQVSGFPGFGIINSFAAQPAGSTE